MVTASHNDKGWTGVKMGANRPLTFRSGRDEPPERDIVTELCVRSRRGGRYEYVENFPRALHRRISPTAEAQAPHQGRVRLRQRHGGRRFAARAEAIGCEVIALDCELDHTFPEITNPNPEDMEMLHAMRERGVAHKAGEGLGFDGDGDRCGVVDNTATRSSPTRSA
jgi:phosphomannomutase/phosphoglucomutase